MTSPHVDLSTALSTSSMSEPVFISVQANPGVQSFSTVMLPGQPFLTSDGQPSFLQEMQVVCLPQAQASTPPLPQNMDYPYATPKVESYLVHPVPIAPKINQNNQQISTSSNLDNESVHSNDPADENVSSSMQMDVIAVASEGLDLDEVRDMIKNFKIKRILLKLNQTKVAEELSSLGRQSFTQSAVCRLEKLDVTTRQLRQYLPILRKWLENADQRLNGEAANCSGDEEFLSSRKRRRRTVFNNDSQQFLLDRFAENPNPNPYHLQQMASDLGMDYRAVRVWFCNRRQRIRNDRGSESLNESADDTDSI